MEIKESQQTLISALHLLAQFCLDFYFSIPGTFYLFTKEAIEKSITRENAAFLLSIIGKFMFNIYQLENSNFFVKLC